jgi:hypothetical protein
MDVKLKKLRIGYKSSCFFGEPHLKWIIYGGFNGQKLYVNVLEEVRRVHQNRTLYPPSSCFCISNNLQEESRCENVGPIYVWFYS